MKSDSAVGNEKDKQAEQKNAGSTKRKLNDNSDCAK